MGLTKQKSLSSLIQPMNTEKPISKTIAIMVMLAGGKVRHRWFSNNEWMSMPASGVILFEDGVRCSVNEFWSIRNDKSWETDWYVVSPPTNVSKIYEDELRD